jgi:hypothetical protein
VFVLPSVQMDVQQDGIAQKLQVIAVYYDVYLHNRKA